MLDRVCKLLLNVEGHGELVACVQAQNGTVANFKESLKDFLFSQDLVFAEHFLDLSNLRLITLLDL